MWIARMEAVAAWYNICMRFEIYNNWSSDSDGITLINLSYHRKIETGYVEHFFEFALFGIQIFLIHKEWYV